VLQITMKTETAPAHPEFHENPRSQFHGGSSWITMHKPFNFLRAWWVIGLHF